MNTMGIVRGIQHSKLVTGLRNRKYTYSFSKSSKVVSDWVGGSVCLDKPQAMQVQQFTVTRNHCKYFPLLGIQAI